MHSHDSLWRQAFALMRQYQQSLASRPVAAQMDVAELCARLGDTLPDTGMRSDAVITQLAAAIEPGLVASSGPRYFGFVTGGTHPAALAADWLTACWDQNAWTHVNSPAATAIEAVAGRWLIALLGLPATAQVGFVTDATMANFSALAAARSHVLAQQGYDVEEFGLIDAPDIAIFVGAAAHASITAAVKMLGLGRAHMHHVATDDQGRMQADDLARQLDDWQGAAIVCAQAGEVNTGAFDPFASIAQLCRQHQAWLHIDGAFGLWAAASSRLHHLVDGMVQADSWTADGHKWLNVPYDCGYVFYRDGSIPRRALTADAAYYPEAGQGRENFHYVPESSRRARGFATYAVLRALGRQGVAELVERCVDLARYMADALRQHDRITVLNDVVLNQVLLRFGDSDRLTDAVMQKVRAAGVCWASGTVWQGVHAMRISISNHATTKSDVDASIMSIVNALDDHA